jgi:hypothetical protein
LVTAVAPVVIKCAGLWVGWPGIFLEADEPEPVMPESEGQTSQTTPAAGLLSKQVTLSSFIRLHNRPIPNI